MNEVGEDEEDEQDTPENFEEFVKGMFPKIEEGGLPPLEWLKGRFRTKSAAIRYLYDKGFTYKQIANHLDIRQQHARNVIGHDLKRGPNETHIDIDFACKHEKTAKAFVDIILKKSIRDTNAQRILYRVCVDCALDLIPGVSRESIEKHLSGVTRS